MNGLSDFARLEEGILRKALARFLGQTTP